MAKSSDLFNKLGKVLEQGIINYKDLSSEFINICKTKRNDFMFKMKIAGKEDLEILKKRIDSLEKSVETLKKKKRAKRVKK